MNGHPNIGMSCKEITFIYHAVVSADKLIQELLQSTCISLVYIRIPIFVFSLNYFVFFNLHFECNMQPALNAI